MDSNNSYYMVQFNDSSSFEFPQNPVLASTPCKLPKSSRPKPRLQLESKDKWSIQQPQYPDDVPGPINFDISINVGDCPTLCIYSKKLKRIYIPMNQILRIKFSWTPTFQPLYLRSAVIFAEDYHKATPVQRCYAHRGPELPQNIGVRYDQLRHVFRVTDPANLYESNYETDVNGILTTRTMLRSKDGEAWIDYHFFCQNSCPTGINRRTTKLVFLIEDAVGIVVAKRSVLIQICSNPKRDKERDESRTLSDSKSSRTKKQPSFLPPLPPNNSRNTCDADETVYSLNISILGEENYKAVLKYAYDVMAVQAIRTGNHQLLKPHMDAVLIKKLDG